MKRSLLLYVSALCIFFTNCTKEPLNQLSDAESRIYVTNYDTAVVFSNYKTFRIADSVANVENNRLSSRTSGTGEMQIIDAVSSALTQRGFTAVTSNSGADLGVTVSTITNTSTHLVDYSNYGGFYGGYWDPFLWGYPSYSYNFPSYYGIYQTDETALSIDIIDLKNASQNGNKLNVVWSGLIRGSGIFSSQSINSQIEALFSQSPYLTTNP